MANQNLPKFHTIASADPKYYFTRETFKNLFLSDEFGYPEELKRWVEKIIDISTIETVPCVIDPHQFFEPREPYDPNVEVDEHNLFKRAKEFWRPTAEERYKVYNKFAPQLTVQAAKTCVAKWGGDKDKIRYVITTTSSGFRMPGLDLDVCDALELKNIAHRLCVDNTGCYGSFSALKVAQMCCQTDPEAFALVVCTEICSPHLQKKVMNRGFVLGNLLFGDGAVAAILGPGTDSHMWPEKSSLPNTVLEDWQMTNIDMFTMGLQTRDYVTVELSDDGYLLYLGKELPPSIAGFLKPNWKKVLKKCVDEEDPNEIEWCVHPGGKAVVSAVQNIEELHLSQHRLRYSWESLRDHGNLAAPSILLVLEKYMKHAQKDKIFVLGFGPGMTVKCYGLSRNQEKKKRLAEQAAINGAVNDMKVSS